MAKSRRTQLLDSIKALAATVPDDRRCVAEAYVSELEFMARTMDKLKQEVNKNGPVELFVNGSQQMLRESPAMKVYNVTVQRWGLICKQLVALLPDEQAEQAGAAIAEFLKNPPKSVEW